jgi:Flp pilus assembly CpaE family ATPase
MREGTKGERTRARIVETAAPVFNRLGYDQEKLMVVANRRSDRDRITMADAERVLGRPVSLALPNDYASCADAITHGQFVQHHASGSPLVTGFRSLANLLSGIPVTADARRGDAGRPRLARLFGRG